MAWTSTSANIGSRAVATRFCIPGAEAPTMASLPRSRSSPGRAARTSAAETYGKRRPAPRKRNRRAACSSREIILRSKRNRLSGVALLPKTCAPSHLGHCAFHEASIGIVLQVSRIHAGKWLGHGAKARYFNFISL